MPFLTPFWMGYTRAKYGFDADTCGVITTIDEQSKDIAMGVDKALEAKENSMSEEEIDAIGAGDQGMMYGYATDETEEFMPYPISLAHKLSRQLTKVRKDGTLTYLSTMRMTARSAWMQWYSPHSMTRMSHRSRFTRILRNTCLTPSFRQTWWTQRQNFSSTPQDVLLSADLTGTAA